MAERFARGGRLLAARRHAGARSDVRHVAVEFVHPVIVGKRALPALGLTLEGGPVAGSSRCSPSRATSSSASAPRSTRAGVRRRGCLTIGFGAARRRMGVRAADG